jgi:ABC-2 type transport system ATP-binding protein
MPEETHELVRVRDLYKIYGETRALEGISFSLKRGEILGLLGPNGAGKTTCIHITLGLLAATSGDVRVMGLSPTKYRFELSKKINFSSAYGHLPTNLKVIENLTLFSRIYNVPDAKKKMLSLLELFEIPHLLNRITGALSSGERTRLNLAKCLLNDPILLILDEPTASLDPEISDKVRQILRSVQRQNNMGILYTSHNMREVEDLCDRILFIHKGKTIAEGTTEEIEKHFETKTLEQAFIKIVRSGEVVAKEGL